jgi:ectoine hydroxylase-related dioxygenase (phytanoyl-CoA dioxygenase family)
MKPDTAVKSIKENGYVLLENILSGKECELYKSLLDRDYKKYSVHYAGSSPTEHSLNDKSCERIVYNLHNKDIRYFDLCCHPSVLPIIKEMLQEGSYQKSEQFNLLCFDARDPNSNTEVQQLHSDSNLPGQGSYPLIMIALFMLDDFTVENGATRILPLSHLRSDYPENKRKYDAEKSIEAGKGSVLIFNGALWHGGGKKTINSSRWAVIPSYGRWFIKPSFDFTRNTPAHIFDQLTEDRKTLLGLNSCPPKDEFTRITRKSKEYEWQPDYELP